MKSTRSTMQQQQPISWGTPGAVQWQPAKYQKQGVSWLIKHPEAALLWDPGLRKTSVTLAAYRLLHKVGAVRRALVVAPLRVAENVWSASGEVGKWEEFADLKVSLIHGTAAQRVEATEVEADIYVTNYDNIAWLAESGGLNTLFNAGVDLLILDELSKVKHTNTKRFKALRPFLGRFKRRWGLTGSPCSNGLEDLFGQVYALDLGHRLGRFISHYRHTYFDPCGFKGYEWKPKVGAEKKIYKALDNLAMSMRAEDHLDLPELVEENLYVDLPTKARIVYDQLENELIALLEQGKLVAANAAVASGKCRQVASGGVYLGDESEQVVHVHSAKTEALCDLVDELQGSPLLVAYEFHHDLERIRTALGAKTPAINGKTSSKQVAELIRAWNKGELPVLCGHPAAMAHGLNLQECGHHVAWYSLTWNYELYDQLIRRLYRSGQRNRVVVHRIIARKTVDECVASALSSKGRGQNALLDALKKLKRRRP